MPKKTSDNSKSYLEKVETDLQSNQSKLSLILGALIVLVVGVLVFNYFNKPKSELGPSQTTDQMQGSDVTPENLPGKYSVKEGDTLFLIAEKYYQDGYQFTEIAQANNLVNVNALEVGQVLEIPKLAETITSPSPAVQPSPESVQPAPAGEKGATPTQQFGSPITGNSYTVVEGDWLSTIAARAYGDILAYQKIAEANKISNPDYITPGMVLSLPR